jgi:hypothetical protein
MAITMPVEYEQKLLERLIELQKSHNAYWIQTKYLANALFGIALTGKEFRTNKNRIFRLAKRLEKKGLITATYKRGFVGKSTGFPIIKYFHTEERK